LKDVRNCSKCGVSPRVNYYRQFMVDEFYEISCPVCNQYVMHKRSESLNFRELALSEWNNNQRRRSRKYHADSNENIQV